MKKASILFLVIVLVLSFTACNKQAVVGGESLSTTHGIETDPTTTAQTEPETSTEETSATVETTEAIEDLSSQKYDPEHIHAYVQTVTNPTCTEDGFTANICSCGDSYNSNKTTAVGHTYGDWETTRNATATATGLSERKCSACGHKETKTLGMILENHTHTYTSQITKDPSCASEGTKTFTCACADAYTETINKISHDYKPTIVEATCVNGGYSIYTCSTCNNHYTADYTTALGHAYKEETIAPTCVNTGYTKHACTRCEAFYHDSGVAALGHSYESKTTSEVTCTTDGVTTYTCSQCSKSYTETTAKTGHSYDAATCLAPKTCTKCNTTSGSALGHAYEGEIIVAATCTTEGTKAYTCSRCSNRYTEALAATGHSYGAASCTKPQTCTKCNETSGSAPGHNYEGKVTTAATCKKEGVKTYTCSRCSDRYTETIAKTDHTYKAASCTEPQSCSVCNATSASALGHSYDSKITTTATCTKDGVKTYTCSRCSHNYTESIPKSGHSYTDATCTKPKTCAACGVTTGTALGHAYKTETVEATCVAEGYTREVCTLCNDEASKTTTPVSGHAYTTRIVSDVAQDSFNNGTYKYTAWIKYTDWEVEQCVTCGYCDMSKMRFRYTDYEAAQIMLGYVNNLRAEVYGTHDYDLVLDDELMRLVGIRAKEISTHYSHGGGTYTNANENIANGYLSIYDQFLGWKNSAGHYANMIDKTHKYFGYAAYNKTAGTEYAKMFAVQLFWSKNAKDLYYPR